jgi:threonine/homoserine/homoserine lactone efflux protein
VTSGQALLAFTAAAGLLTVTPGLDTALVLRTAAVEGARRAVSAGMGICLGCLCWGLAAAAGLGALLAVSTLAYDTLRILGGCYLAYLGASLLLRSRTAPSLRSWTRLPAPRARGQAIGARHWFARGLLTNLLNPKVGVFYVSLLPQFVPLGVPVRSFSMLLATIHAAEGLLWFTLLTLATARLSGWLDRPGVARALDRATGLVFVGFALALVGHGRR